MRMTQVMKRILPVLLAIVAALFVLGMSAPGASAASAWRYPAPKGISAYAITSKGYRVKWDAVKGPGGQVPSSYTVKTVNASQKVVDQFTVKKLSAAEYGKGGKGLAVGWYETFVWANGSPLAPSHAAIPVNTINAEIAAYVKNFYGIKYVWGGNSPSQGFDCSGLTKYVYAHFGFTIPRVADDQFHYFHMESESAAEPGDLIFFHDTSDPSSHVYHVGVWEGNYFMVAASSAYGKVIWESTSWAGSTATWGTITH